MEDSLILQSPKRLKASQSSGGLVNQISDLHDSIVLHILSFLPTKDAIKFCTLSRQWNSLWKSTPNLIFYCVDGDIQEIYKFRSFVDKTLTAHNSSKISKFLLEFPYINCFAIEEKTESWIRFAKSHGVEELCMNFKGRSYKENGVLFANCSVIKMSLTSMCLRCYEGNLCVHWMALKVLSLVDTIMKADVIRSVLLGSPVIEFLTLRNCTFCENDASGKCVIDAASTSLKELVIDGCAISNRVQGPFEITAPNLLSLTLAGKMATKALKLVDVSSLVEATIDFSLAYPWSSHGNNLATNKKIQKNLFQKLRHINKFTIGAQSLQVVSIRSVEGSLFGKSRCKILKVTMNLNMTYLPGIAALLNSSPELEQLTVEIMPTIDANFNLFVLSANDDFIEENYWRSKMSKAKSLFQNLEIVNIVGFIPGSSSNLGKIMVEIAQFLLANAKVLQKLIVHAKATSSHDKSWTSQQESLKIFEKLLCCPRASPNAVIILKH